MRKIYILMLSTIIYYVGWASFEVAPPIQILDLNKPLTRQFHLKNNSKKLVKIKIYPKRPDNQKDEKLYMGEWTIVYPKIVYLKPSEKKAIRFAVRAPEGFEQMEDGEYRTLLIFEQMENKVYSTEEGEGVGEAPPSVGLQILHTIAVSVYGNKGEIEHRSELKKLRVEDIEGEKFILGDIVNTGNATIDPVVRVTFSSGDKVLKEIDQPYPKVIRENTKELKLKLNEIPKKTRQIKIEVFEAGGEKLDEESITL
ncbi:hypothetical protein PM10SUCC1_33780 [Propionigenium maris DSM 9537]|uniref:Pili assembly chaperone N-terminal domain-containing protein n=1 Tax=Propionigenium maris DSM 9537 TaxID=1123000 RepID=A0A9W6GML8_9FUSO|nr:hypothetical protein [Propionigenium maris]GLI57864.1 hypothetical protein PM10SUCC1_33780 [Propionigenium maris DSM 9537]